MALTETTHSAGFLLSEGNGNISRDVVTLVSGENVVAGTVLGKITATGKYAAYDQNAGDGTETAAAIALNACDATGGDTDCTVISRSAEVIGDELEWGDNCPTEATAGVADLAGVGIIVR